MIRVQNGMNAIATEPDMLWEMERRYKILCPVAPTLNQKTQVAKRDSRLAGILGEIVFERMYPTAKRSTDLRWDYWYRDQKIDVKCKLRKVPPHYGLDASIYAYQLRNCQADVYYFMSTIADFTIVWLCGWIGRKEMINHPASEHWKAGDIDDTNGKRFSADTLNLPYSKLNKIRLERT